MFYINYCNVRCIQSNSGRSIIIRCQALSCRRHSRAELLGIGMIRAFYLILISEMRRRAETAERWTRPTDFDIGYVHIYDCVLSGMFD